VWTKELSDTQIEAIQHLLNGQTVKDEQLQKASIVKTVIELPLRQGSLEEMKNMPHSQSSQDLIRKVMNEMHERGGVANEYIYIKKPKPAPKGFEPPPERGQLSSESENSLSSASTESLEEIEDPLVRREYSTDCIGSNTIIYTLF
jgi:hypothetical protein